MRTERILRLMIISLVILLLGGVGCSAPSGGSGASASGEADVIDGLRKTPIDMPGVLYIKDQHGIGSYDAFLIPQATITYKRSSRKLPEEMELEFVASLEQSLIDAAADSRIPVVQEAGECVMQVGMGLTNVEIERYGSRTLGQMTLVMEFRDTVSGEPLLRYATQNEIENSGDDEPRSEQIRAAFDEMILAMDISGALRAAGLGDDAIRPGCRGTLAERGRGALRARQQK